MPPELPFIAFNKPFIGPRETAAITEALGSGILRGDGPISKRVEACMREWLEVKHVYFTTSCTHALEMAMIALGIGPDDEVIMPSFTFVSSANAVVLRGATPVFAEIDPYTLNIDPADVARRISRRTRAVVPVHYAGVACDMDALLEMTREHDLYVIEDAAQGVDAYHGEAALGTLGHIGCYSFHDTKNITSGEGGAFITNDEDIAGRAELVREKGTNRSAFFRGEVDKYNWVSRGSSYIQSDILAALLEVQLQRRDEIREKRERVWHAYYEALEPFAKAGDLILPVIPHYARSNYHIFFFRVTEVSRRDSLLQALKESGIQATFHYVPLHSSPYGRDVLGCTVELPVTQVCSETLIRLPIYPQLADSADEIAERVSRVTSRHLQTSLLVG